MIIIISNVLRHFRFRSCSCFIEGTIVAEDGAHKGSIVCVEYDCATEQECNLNFGRTIYAETLNLCDE